MVLDLLNENLPWRACDDDKDEIKRIKETCLDNAENLLLRTTCKNRLELLVILEYIKKLNYEDRPNYEIIRKSLVELKKGELVKYFQSTDLNSNANMFNFLPFCSNSNHNSYLKDNNSSSNLLSKIASTMNMSRIESNDVTIKIPNLRKKRRRFSFGGNQKNDFLGVDKIERKYTKNDYSTITEDNTLLSFHNNNNIFNPKIDDKCGLTQTKSYTLFAEYVKQLKKKKEESPRQNYYVPGNNVPGNNVNNGTNEANFCYYFPQTGFFPVVQNYNYFYYDPCKATQNMNNFNNLNLNQKDYFQE